MKLLLTLLLASLTASAAADAPVNPMNDRWGRVRFLLGSWEGAVSGKPGKRDVERTYELTLDGQFIEERSARHRGFMSYDKERRTFMLRRFDQNGTVTLSALNTGKSMAEYLIFDSVSSENLGSEWKVRASYDVISADEFEEIVEVAEPGKDFVEISRSHFKRKKQK